MGDQPDAELAQERAGDGAEGDARRRLAGARALEHVAGLVEAVLLHADQVGVTRVAGRVSGAPRPFGRLSASTGSGLITSTQRGHSVLPMRRATGLPIVRPKRMPPEIESSSSSNFMRAPRP